MERAALFEAVRVQPGLKAIQSAMEYLEALDAMSGDKKEKMYAGALRIFIENSAKARAAIELIGKLDLEHSYAL